MVSASGEQDRRQSGVYYANNVPVSSNRWWLRRLALECVTAQWYKAGRRTARPYGGGREKPGNKCSF